jgi:hypothetical protein
MPDHEGRPPRARERVDATAPGRKRAFRDAEFVESHDENLSAEASRDQSCSPTWSVVSLSELTSRASSPGIGSCSSVVAAAALAEDEEDEAKGDPFPNEPPSEERETNVKNRQADGSLPNASGETDAVKKRRTFLSSEEPTPRKSLSSPAEPFPPPSALETARRLVACLLAATAKRLHALARALEAENEPPPFFFALPFAPRREPDASARGDAVEQSHFFLKEALKRSLKRLLRFSRSALAALDASARTCASTLCRLVADARLRFFALFDAFEERVRFFFASREETSKREKKKNPFLARDVLVAAAVALAPLAPAALWCAFSRAYSKRT